MLRRVCGFRGHVPVRVLYVRGWVAKGLGIAVCVLGDTCSLSTFSVYSSVFPLPSLGMCFVLYSPPHSSGLLQCLLLSNNPILHSNSKHSWMANMGLPLEIRGSEKKKKRESWLRSSEGAASLSKGTASSSHTMGRKAWIKRAILTRKTQ